ncbi:putative cytochrome b-c1 complex subunit 6, mitochondrial [Apostichopus japonicus]|uniref:Putative cytochrome b-c1 complex subunit 6, mitochondrial n=1 Tax=Stichopus japonicus TaxID=307972 RepID=A0A2G8L697_STIJA|nr:putative cytochrome b-c1 complex subunit 6, mitochondrial [Apostichopus japonicus]
METSKNGVVGVRGREEEEEEEDDEDEEDLVDPRDELVEKCGEHCEKIKAELDACTERVTNKPGTEEMCTQELFDFLHCVDHCTGPKTLALYK